jgi:hypothetical protein
MTKHDLKMNLQRGQTWRTGVTGPTSGEETARMPRFVAFCRVLSPPLGARPEGPSGQADRSAGNLTKTLPKLDRFSVLKGWEARTGCCPRKSLTVECRTPGCTSVHFGTPKLRFSEDRNRAARGCLRTRSRRESDRQAEHGGAEDEERSGRDGGHGMGSMPPVFRTCATQTVMRHHLTPDA